MSAQVVASDGTAQRKKHRFRANAPSKPSSRKKSSKVVARAAKKSKRPEIALQQQNLINLADDRRETRIADFAGFAIELKATWLRFNFFVDEYVDEQVYRIRLVLDALAQNGFVPKLQITLVTKKNRVYPADLNLTGWIETVSAQVVVAAKRLISSVSASMISIWNEPNLRSWLRPANIHLSDEDLAARNGPVYARLYQKVYSRLRKAGFEMPILFGELSSRCAVQFLTATFDYLRKIGSRLCANGFALHPYQYQTSPDDTHDHRFNGGMGALEKIKTQIKKSRRLVQTGTTHKVPPLYLTEFGYHRSTDSTRKLGLTKRIEYTKLAFRIATQAGVKQVLYYQVIAAPKEKWDTAIVGANLVRRGNYKAVRAWQDM